MPLRKQSTCKDCGEPIYGDDYGPVGHACKPKKVVGFLPMLECPVCFGVHEVKYTYKGNPLLSCPKMEPGQIYFTDPLEQPKAKEAEAMSNTEGGE